MPLQLRCYTGTYVFIPISLWFMNSIEYDSRCILVLVLVLLYKYCTGIWSAISSNATFSILGMSTLYVRYFHLTVFRCLCSSGVIVCLFPNPSLIHEFHWIWDLSLKVIYLCTKVQKWDTEGLNLWAMPSQENRARTFRYHSLLIQSPVPLTGTRYIYLVHSIGDACYTVHSFLSYDWIPFPHVS